MTEIRDPLKEAALISKHEPAVICDDASLLYYELDYMVSTAAWHLQQAGCREGERVALLLEPGLQYVILLLAVIRMGGVACPLNTRLPVPALRAQLDHIACRKLIAVAGVNTQGLEGVELLDGNAFIETTVGNPRFGAAMPIVLDRPATIVFTSGSSGRPKAVMHTYGNHYYSALGSNINIKVGSHDKWLLSLPLFHVGGLGILFRCILSGAAVAIPRVGVTTAAAQEQFEATHLSMVEAQLYRLLYAAAIPPSFLKVKATLLGGGPVRDELLREAIARKLPVFMSYGMTEMTSQVATVQPKSPPEKRYTSGLPLKYRQCRVSSDGEILVKGHVLCAGYVDGHDVVLPLDADGWFATGDLGGIDDDGYLTVRGRKDNMFVSGGENIQPEEIEQALRACEGVEDACVVPVPDLEFGHRPVAFVKARTGALDMNSINSHLENFLPRYKLPVAYHRWPVHLEDEGLKTDRAVLRELAKRGTS